MVALQIFWGKKHGNGGYACIGGGGRGCSQVALVVTKLPASARDIRDWSSVSGLGRAPGRGHGKPLQYSCLKNPMDRGAWWAIVHAKSWT